MIAHFKLAAQPPLPVPAAEDYARAALNASRGGWPGVAEYRDIPFGAGDWQRFDLFTPTGGKDMDLMIFFHGGGWTNGYKEWCGFMAPALAAHGVALAAPTYRLAPGVRYPTFLEDALDAIAAIAAQARTYGGNPRRLFLAGHSAGGHVAALAGLRSDLWARHGIAPDTIKGCLPVSGILDLHHPNPPQGSLEERVYSDVLADRQDDHDASPLNWLSPLRLPLFLSWGTKDTERVQRSNTAAMDAVSGAAHRCWFRSYDQDHFGTHLMLRDPAHDWYHIFNIMRKDTL